MRKLLAMAVVATALFSSPLRSQAPARVLDLAMVDLDGAVHRIGADPEPGAAALVFVDVSCPIARRYVPRLNELAAASRARGVAFYGVLSDAELSWHDARTFRDDYQVAFPLLMDGSGTLAARLQPQRVPEAFVLDADDRLAYRGRIDDWFAAPTRPRKQATTNELEAAVHSRTRQLEGVLSEMETATENRKRLLADVSHELRTPLTIIRGEADVALRGGDKPAEDYREALSRASDAAAHTSRLVDDLLFVARSEAGAAKLDVAEIDLVALARGAAQLVDRPVEMALSSPTALVEADAQRLRQCVLILLENAARYGGAGVTIRVDKSVGGYRVAVEDNGPGMTEEERSRAFQRYFHGSDAASHYSEGVGLGLPVAKSIVDAHGGAITIDERAGGGLIVAFTVPARAKGIAA